MDIQRMEYVGEHTTLSYVSQHIPETLGVTYEPKIKNLIGMFTRNLCVAKLEIVSAYFLFPLEQFFS